MKTGMNIVYYGFILAVCALGGLLLLVQMDVLTGYELRIVQSGSMEPAIATGALVLVQAQGEYAVNDVVTYRDAAASGIPTTHRIIEQGLQRGELVYTTKGDANEAADPQPLTSDEIIGKVQFDVPYLGYILDFARQPLGFVLLIVLPGLLIVFEEASTLWKEIRGKKIKADVQTTPTV